ncbi:MAG: AgmX/PglI C-terminal domain-containing protein [Candidatus Eisenbacteria bacterium]
MSVRALTWTAVFPQVPKRYRQPIYGHIDRRFLQCLAGAGSLAVIALLVIYTQPYRPAEVVQIADLSPRFAKLVREVEKEAKVEAPAAPFAKPSGKVSSGTHSGSALPWPGTVPNAAPGPPGELSPRPGARGPGHGPGSGGGSGGGVGNGGGVQGRALSAALAGAQQSLGSSLAGLGSSLDASGVRGGSGAGAVTGVGTNATGANGGVSARRSPRGGRAASDLALAGGYGAGGAPGSGGGQGDGAGGGDGGALAGAVVSVESVLPLAPSGGGGGDGGGGGGGGGASVGGRRRGASGESGGTAESKPYRSNASLLAVVRRNAAGIQFCYDNELKHQPGLRGKLVIAMSVAPSGEVSALTTVSNSVDSSPLLDCVLAQIREWRFPAIAEGVTRFQVPFVFTPPK